MLRMTEIWQLSLKNSPIIASYSLKRIRHETAKS